MDKNERAELRRRRLERLGKWNPSSPPPPPQSTQPVPVNQSTFIGNNNRRCGCSRSKA